MHVVLKFSESFLVDGTIYFSTLSSEQVIIS